MNRLAATLVSLALIGLVLEPLLRSPDADGFPLSTYPMFAYPRPTRVVVSYAVGMTRTGQRALTPALVGSGEVLQALVIVERALGGGSLTKMALCTQIAARVQADPGFADVILIRIVVGTHEAVEYLVRHAPGREVERARCPVTR